MNNPLPTFYRLVAEAHEASEASDRFDLKSGDPASTKQFQELEQASALAARALITHVSMFRDRLVERLEQISVR